MAAPPPVDRSKKKNGILSSPLPVNSIDSAPVDMDSMTLTSLEKQIEADQQQAPKVNRKKKGKKKAEASSKSPHLSYGMYEQPEWGVEYENPGKQTEAPQMKKEKSSFLGKMFHREKSSQGLPTTKSAGEVPTIRQNSVPDLDMAIFGGKASVIKGKLGGGIEKNVLPETAEAFFAELDESQPEEDTENTMPSQVDEKKRMILKDISDEVIQEAKTNFERNVFDLQLFYHKVDPKKKDAEAKSRELLTKYPPGNVAVALEKKYGEIPIGWGKYLAEAKLRLQSTK